MHRGATLSLNYEIIPLFKSASALVSEVSRSVVDLMDFSGLARWDKRATGFSVRTGRQPIGNVRLFKRLGPSGAV